MHAPQIDASTTAYRPDIDGLRALAVVAVLLFHLRVSGFSGGFVGVDVFFVISGYLITGMIVRDLNQQRFSVWRFYARRGRRLLPAMFLVIAFAGVAAFLLLSPEHMIGFAKSAVASIFLVSNFVFWQEAGYFDLAGRMKPLLHLWTLSLEWQFYLVWPAVLAFAASGRARFFAPVAVAATGLISLCAGIFLKVDPSTVFYQMPFRVFEFAIGALLIWMPNIRRRGIADLACLVGLVLISVAVMKYDGKKFYGSLAMLIPTIGAALVIMGGQRSYSGLTLRNPVSSYIGRISYSVYLVHWPLIVFTEYFNFSPLNRDQTVVIFFASIALGALLHHLVEKPIHKRQVLNFTPRYAGPMVTGLVALAVAFPALLAIPHGLSWRIDKDALKFSFLYSKVPSELFGYLGCKEPCTFGDAAGAKILVIGDSHVDHFTKTLNTMGGAKYHFFYAGSASCFNGATLTAKSPNYPAITEACQKAREVLIKWLATIKFDAAIVGQRWIGYHGGALYRGDEKVQFADWAATVTAELADTEALLRNLKGPIIIAGWAPNTNAACYRRPRYLPMNCPSPGFDDYDVFRGSVNAFLARTSLDVKFVDVAATICPDRKCKVADSEGRILYTDSDHLSIYGAALVVPQFLNIIANRTP